MTKKKKTLQPPSDTDSESAAILKPREIPLVKFKTDGALNLDAEGKGERTGANTTVKVGEVGESKSSSRQEDRLAEDERNEQRGRFWNSALMITVAMVVTTILLVSFEAFLRCRNRSQSIQQLDEIVHEMKTATTNPSLMWKDPLGSWSELRCVRPGHIEFWTMNKNQKWEYRYFIDRWYFGYGMWGFETFNILQYQNDEHLGNVPSSGVSKEALDKYFLRCAKEITNPRATNCPERGYNLKTRQYGHIGTTPGSYEELDLSNDDVTIAHLTNTDGGGVRKMVLHPPCLNPDGDFQWFQYGGISFFSWDKKGEPMSFVQCIHDVQYYTLDDLPETVFVNMVGRTWRDESQEYLEVKLVMTWKSFGKIGYWIDIINNRAKEDGHDEIIAFSQYTVDSDCEEGG